MAYTIKFLSANEQRVATIHAYLLTRMAKEGKFRATLTSATDSKGHPIIVVKPVRLMKAKPYCGNHPGECQANGKPKKTMTYLEWNDWVEFHNLVNRCLNKFHANADVYSTPADVRGKMWIRRGKQARLRYDWEEHMGMYGMVRTWDQGSPSQFIKQAT